MSANYGLSFKNNATALNIFKAIYTPKKGRFAGSARPNENYNLASFYVKANTTDNRLISKTLYDPFDF